MQRQPVSSSRILSIGYDPDNRMLEIQFREQGTYQYLGVPERAHQTYVCRFERPFFDGVIKASFVPQIG
ncbi:KTSC domain-containing protein [Yersinia pestis]|nr:KTSC domain-containing protein [Yersinia pestis]